MELYTIVTHELKLATLHELQTVYTTADVYDMLEMLEVHTALTVAARKEADMKAAK